MKRRKFIKGRQKTVRRPTLADSPGGKQLTALRKRFAKALVSEMAIGDPLANSISGWVPLVKIDPEKREVWGIASTSKLDSQGEVVEWEATKKAIEEYSQWRNLREMHQPKAVGTVPVLKLNESNQQLMICGKVVDDDAWKKVKEGVYKGFSLGGQATTKVKEFEAAEGKVISKVKAYNLNEISLVDRPANPECVFTVIKRDSRPKDHLAREVQSIQKRADDLSVRVLDDTELRKLTDSEFALVRKFKKGGRAQIQRFLPIPDAAHAISVLNQLKILKFSQKEKSIIHERVRRRLGSLHKAELCPYCSTRASDMLKRGGENETMSLSKRSLARAISTFNRLGSILEAEGVLEPYDEDVEGEGTIEPEIEYVEQEDRRTADTKEDFEDGMDEFKGPESEGYDDIDAMLAELEGEETWEGDVGFEPTLTEDDERTNLFNSEEEAKDQKEIEGLLGELEEELEALELEGEEDEDEDEGASVPTMKLLKSLTREVAGLKRDIAKSRKPIPRREQTRDAVEKVARPYGGDTGIDENLAKAMKALDGDKQRALDLRKSVASGHALTSEEEAFCQNVADRCIKAKALGVSQG